MSIPAGFNYAVVSFSYFKLAPGDAVMLEASGSPTWEFPVRSDSTVPSDIWISGSAAISFRVTFSVGVGSSGDTGFAIEYECK